MQNAKELLLDLASACVLWGQKALQKMRAFVEQLKQQKGK